MTFADEKITIREVWAHNADYEFRLIRYFIDRFRCISMDTEFPGTIHNGSGRSCPSDLYKTLKQNVDELKLIQLGITLSDSAGNLPTLPSGERCIWQFNFSDFDLEHDSCATVSIELLKTHGLDFEMNRAYGISSARFAELMMGSGLVCNDEVSWITFHSAYDFGYLLKTLTGDSLPGDLSKFLEVMRAYFGDNVYDVKYMIQFCSLFGGLDRVSKALDVKRVVGKCHTAGSDSLLTWHTFEKMRDLYFVKQSPEKHAGVLYGLEVN